MWIDPKVGVPGIAGAIFTIVLTVIAVFAPEIADEIKANPELSAGIISLLTAVIMAFVGYNTRNAASPPKSEASAGDEERTTVEAELPQG